MRQLVRTMTAVVIGAAVTAGCGGDGNSVKTVNVSGTVLVDGKPVEGVEVNFAHPEFAGFGKTDAQGKYTLIAGAAPGENLIFFSKIEGQGIELNPEEGMDAEQLRAMGLDPTKAGPNQLIPEEYSDPAQAKLKYTVPDGGTDSADFQVPGKSG